MAFSPVNNLVATVAEASPAQFEDWRKSWRAAADAGSAESLLTFVARERGVAEDVFIQKLATALGWPFLELPKLTIENEVRGKLSTKIAFQYFVAPVAINNGVLQVAVSDPFDAAMMNAVRFDAKMPVSFALATRGEIEKALKTSGFRTRRKIGGFRVSETIARRHKRMDLISCATQPTLVARDVEM